jgi:prepilin-type N-terminal cleavage/methylation domain-containing protein
MRYYEHTAHKGFTLIEILVSVGIIALLSSVILSATNSARKNARDAKRVASIREMQTGLELYYNTYAHYPDSDGGGPVITGIGNWDTPSDGTFISPLVTNHFMQGHTLDPLGASYQDNLRYFRFDAGSYGCPAERGAFYVLGIVDMETSDGRYQLSPGWSCAGFDFNDPSAGGFEYVVGKYEQ